MIHQGTHQPLIDPPTWQQVQDVLASHLVGERQRKHVHYLKSSVFCGTCGSRLIITNAKNRYGVVYPYFLCLGRHLKTTDCTRKALLITKVEKMVKDHWPRSGSSRVTQRHRRRTAQRAGHPPSGRRARAQAPGQ